MCLKKLVSRQSREQPTVSRATILSVWRIDCGNMHVSVPFLIILIAVAHAASGPCATQRLQAAFLKDVVDGLPESLQEELCLASSEVMTVSPDATGVSHFVLPGFIPKALLGEAEQGYNLVTHEEQYIQSPDAAAAVMHLWLRALCIGYGATAASCYSCHSQLATGLCSASLATKLGLSLCCYPDLNDCLQRQYHDPRLRLRTRLC